jgi:hypothetical protein
VSRERQPLMIVFATAGLFWLGILLWFASTGGARDPRAGAPEAGRDPRRPSDTALEAGTRSVGRGPGSFGNSARCYGAAADLPHETPARAC